MRSLSGIAVSSPHGEPVEKPRRRDRDAVAVLAVNVLNVVSNPTVSEYDDQDS